MPHRKKTSTTNKKRNKKLQQERERQGKQVDSSILDFLGAQGESIEPNRLYAKKVSYELFGKYKDNIIYGKTKDKKTSIIIKKLIDKNKLQYQEVARIEFEKEYYYVNGPAFEDWEKRIQGITRFSKSAGERLDKEDIDWSDIYTELLFRPPKLRREDMNFNVGFLGSIWIDTPDKYRIALYNGDNKNYNVKDFKPTFALLDNSDGSCKYTRKTVIYEGKCKEGHKYKEIRADDETPNIED